MSSRDGLSGARRSGQGSTASRTSTVRSEAVRAYLHRWTETAGAQLLVVDPDDDGGALADAMAGRGVHVTWVGSTVDGLVAFGRTDPHAVVVAPDAPGIAPEEFVGVVRRHGSPFVIAGDDRVDWADRADRIGRLVLAGAAAVLGRPYEPESLWELLAQAPRSLAGHARLVVGAVELDAAAYSVRVHGERIADLPLKEFELLRALMLRAPGVVTDDELREAVWGASPRRPGGNAIAMHVTRLRARLACAGAAVVVRRIRGRGYSLTVEGG